MYYKWEPPGTYFKQYSLKYVKMRSIKVMKVQLIVISDSIHKSGKVMIIVTMTNIA